MYRFKTLVIILLVFFGWAGVVVLGTLAVVIGAPLVRLVAFVKSRRAGHDTLDEDRPSRQQARESTQF